MSRARSRSRGSQPHRPVSAPSDRLATRLATNVPAGSGARRIVFLRHVGMAAVTALLVFVFWSTRMEWSADMRLWRAVGDAAIVLLFAALP